MFAYDPSDRSATTVDVHGRAVATLVGDLRREELSQVGDVRLVDDFTALQRAMHDLELERLRRLAEIERRGIYAHDGHLSAAPWRSEERRVGKECRSRRSPYH